MQQPYNIKTTADKNLNKNLKSTICTLYIWQTCSLEIKSRSSNLLEKNVHPKQGYHHAKLERSHFNSVWEKGNVKVFLKSEKMSFTSLEYFWRSKIVMYYWSTWCNQQLYKVSTLSSKNITFSAKTVWHCCDLEIQSKSLKVVWMDIAQFGTMAITIIQSLTLII